jgi:hypothetical protein
MVCGYTFEEEAVHQMRGRAESGFGYARDLQPDLIVCVTALENILAIHKPMKLTYSDGFACAVDYDRPWPCGTRAAIREALLDMRRMAQL